jgi:hypothetical protein
MLLDSINLLIKYFLLFTKFSVLYFWVKLQILNIFDMFYLKLCLNVNL